MTAKIIPFPMAPVPSQNVPYEHWAKLRLEYLQDKMVAGRASDAEIDEAHKLVRDLVLNEMRTPNMAKRPNSPRFGPAQEKSKSLRDKISDILLSIGYAECLSNPDEVADEIIDLVRHTPREKI